MSCDSTQTSDEGDSNTPCSDLPDRESSHEGAADPEWVTDWMDEPPPYLPTEDFEAIGTSA